MSPIIRTVQKLLPDPMRVVCLVVDAADLSKENLSNLMVGHIILTASYVWIAEDHSWRVTLLVAMILSVAHVLVKQSLRLRQPLLPLPLPLLLPNLV